MYPVISKTTIAPGISRLEVEAPLIAKKRKPGNFVIVMPVEKGERIPLTIVESDPKNGTITLIVQAIGKTTHIINKMEAGDHFIDVVGPLGEPTPIKNVGTVVCVGGGVGTAVIYPMAKALKDAGNRVIGIIGARNRKMIILKDEMADCSDEIHITTDDGTYGLKGFVTDALARVIDENKMIQSVYTTGPLPMMKAVAELTRKFELHTMASLNPIMMDGTGMCGACRVSVGGELKFTCVDGPEFDAHKVNFDELIQRNKTYFNQEKKSLDAYNEKCKTRGAYV